MSRWSKSRAQTEPFAAIISVGMLVIGIGIFAVYMGGLVPNSGQSATADQTIDLVWNDIEEDGTFYGHDDGEQVLTDSVTADALPAGATVYVRVTAIDEDGQEYEASAGFPSGYPDDTSVLDVWTLEDDVESEGIPERASVATRTIPITVENRANTRTGTLEVAVW
ncbi:DUF7285 family protein [Natranaeroarchaeum aerophilus]|uniref:Uncharacterized protein n=1 Tax=Natranaeroarchaeum aerophilus TaxID=2917711 RepID=A0AAE3K4U4_9EURY|nr:hypothetical protein [Natranaeroarchaeum aerophilus]MCL9812905.1 hypothetical protein [Natranaeroarchaeum aerophilus]